MKKSFLISWFLFSSICFIKAMEEVSKEIANEINKHNSQTIKPYLTDEQCINVAKKSRAYIDEAITDHFRAVSKNVNYSLGISSPLMKLFLNSPFLVRLPVHEEAEKVFHADEEVKGASCGLYLWCYSPRGTMSTKEKEDSIKKLETSMKRWSKLSKAFFLYVAKQEYPNLPQNISLNHVFPKLFLLAIKKDKIEYLKTLAHAKDQLALEETLAYAKTQSDQLWDNFDSASKEKVTQLFKQCNNEKVIRETFKEFEIQEFQKIENKMDDHYGDIKQNYIDNIKRRRADATQPEIDKLYLNNVHKLNEPLKELLNVLKEMYTK